MSIAARMLRMRRCWFVAACVVSVLAAVAAALWVLWLPHYRPGLRADEVYGIDVSNHQGDIDWDAVAHDDIGFAYVKASEGGDFLDAWFERNWDDALAADLQIGAYHFFTLCTPGAEQAENFLSVLPIAEMTLPAALDLEFAGNCASRPSREWVHSEVQTFIELLEEQTGEPVVLYVSSKFDNAYQVLDSFDRRTWLRMSTRIGPTVLSKFGPT